MLPELLNGHHACALMLFENFFFKKILVLFNSLQKFLQIALCGNEMARLQNYFKLSSTTNIQILTILPLLMINVKQKHNTATIS